MIYMQVLNLLVWAVSATLACMVLYGLYDSLNDNPLSTNVSSLYNATHRSVWGACVCWVIYACATGNGGFVNTLLSWSVFGPLARLSYCLYLVHPVIMYAYSYSSRTSIYLTDFTAVCIILTKRFELASKLLLMNTLVLFFIYKMKLHIYLVLLSRNKSIYFI